MAARHKGQTILITGATAGIGRHAALYLSAKGHRVIATGRNRAALATLRTQARTIDTIVLDVTDSASVTDAVAEVDRLTDGRGIDVLVNNAGYGVAGPLAEVPDAKLREQFDVNVFGLMSVTRAFLPKMMARGSGRVLNVSSVSGLISAPLLGAYHATKFALETMSDSLRMELAPFGIQVVLIEPGTIRTEFAERSARELGDIMSTESPYAPAYAELDKIRARFTAAAASPTCISEAMAQAISARRPKARYVAPARFAIATLIVRLLPTRVTDAIMSRAMGLAGVRPKRQKDGTIAEHHARP